MKTIYLDYAATTPVDPRVVETMLPYFSEHFGNPSSVHYFGQKADAALEGARQAVADVFQSKPDEIVFTSCGTESDNMALCGAARLARKERDADTLLITPLEHHAIEKTAEYLVEREGFKLQYIPVDSTGQVILPEFNKILSPKVAIVSVIYGNNEIGTLNPIPEIGRLCRGQGVLFHTDAVQAAGSCTIAVPEINADLISIGAHKFYGPKGIGALYIRDGIKIEGLLHGGPQEMDLRPGTQNVPLIVGLAKALTLAVEEREATSTGLISLRDKIIASVLEQIPNAALTGHPQQRLANHASFIFPGVNGNELVMLLDHAGFACSSGSACKTGNPEPSKILLSIGVSYQDASGSLRVTIGKHTTVAQVEAFLAVLPALVAKSRK